MIVLLHNNWFDGAKWYDKGRVEYNGPKELLPSGHIILSENGSLPVASNSPKAGFGAKPMEEQIMDLAGMGPTHQISLPVGSDLSLTDEELAERQAKAVEAKQASDAAARETRDAGIDQLRQETEAGIAAANAAFEKIEPSIDPLAAVQETGPADAVTAETETVTEPASVKDKNAVDPFAKTKK